MNKKNKYVFEMYEFGNRGRIFKGYKTVEVVDNSEAVEIANQGLDENVVFAQIYIPHYNV